MSACQLKNDPSAYNHQLVEVTAFVSHDFEDFTLFEPTCPSWPAVWLEYGGTAKSGTMYCCGVTADRRRAKELTIENIPITLLENDQFSEFDKLIQPPFRSDRHGSIVHATLVGRFFAGREMQVKNGSYWGGYGHMGCCSLLAIQEVTSVSPQDRDDLDYGASPDQPNIGKSGCGYRILTPLQPAADLIKTQREAEIAQEDWMFSDPERAGSEAIAKFAKIEPTSVARIKETRKSQGRFVYEWKSTSETYMIVVSRPYWLSFYANDAKRVSWVVIAAYASSCDGENNVIRLR